MPRSAEKTKEIQDKIKIIRKYLLDSPHGIAIFLQKKTGLSKQTIQKSKRDENYLRDEATLNTINILYNYIKN